MLDTPVTVGHIDGQNPDVIRYALDEAVRQGRALRVLHVIEDSDPSEDPDGQATPRLTDHHPTVPVDYATRRGDAATILLEECGTSACLVLGSDDPARTPARWSEVAQLVALHASIPVIVVPERPSAPAHTANVLVAVDGTQPNEAQLAYAVEIAERRHTGLDVVFGAGAGSDYPGRMADVLRREHHPDRGRRPHPAVTIHASVEGGHPVESCLEAATHASLLVVGRPQAKHPRVGSRSVASRILRRAGVPVAVIPADYVPSSALELAAR